MAYLSLHKCTELVPPSLKLHQDQLLCRLMIQLDPYFMENRPKMLIPLKKQAPQTWFPTLTGHWRALLSQSLNQRDKMVKADTSQRISLAKTQLHH